LIGAALAYALPPGVVGNISYFVLGIAVVIAVIVSASIKVANQWNRAIVLRLGHFQALRGPGLFLLYPLLM